MPGRNPKGSTIRQMAYARRVFNGDGASKKQVALEVGYGPNVANSVVSKIESKGGFQNAIALLARDSGNLALAAMNEMKARGFKDFSNKEIISAITATANAWSKFNAPLANASFGNGRKSDSNKLRTVILQRVENQTIGSTEPVEKGDVAEQLKDFMKNNVVESNTTEEVKPNLDF